MERVYTRHIDDMGICLKYTRYMDGIYYEYAEKVEIYSVYTMIIHGIYFMVYPLYIPRLYIVYALYIYCIYLVYILYIFGIYNVYALYIHCIYMYNMRIYSTRWLVLRRRTGSHSTCSTSNNIQVAWTSHNFYFTGTRNRMSYQEYTRYIPGIFKVYTKCLPVDKLLNPVAGLAQRLFIGLCLTSTCVCPIFSRDTFF
jgi:hypothetical protein